MTSCSTLSDEEDEELEEEEDDKEDDEEEEEEEEEEVEKSFAKPCASCIFRFCPPLPNVLGWQTVQ